MRVASYPTTDGFSQTLAADLTQIGVPSLQHNVQCFDIVDGCLATLFHLKIVQHTGATGDLLLFQPVAAPPVVAARAWYSGVMKDDPPAVYVVSNMQFGMPRRSFDKIGAWPAFAADLRAHYRLLAQREFSDDGRVTSHLGEDSQSKAYRMYVRVR